MPANPPPGPVLCGGVACRENEICCVANGTCFDPKTQADACAPPADDQDPNGRTVCSSNADCTAIEFCQPDNANLCQGSGHCQPIGNCGTCSPGCTVCACDGNTYPSIQDACLARTSVTFTYGACGESTTVGGGGTGGAATTVTPCGTNDDCATGELCCPITALCYPESDPDRCRTPPPGTTFPCTSNDQCRAYEYCAGDGCSGPGGCKSTLTHDCGVTLEPVCGCDGTTYTSAACAVEKGVRVAAAGNCDNK